MALLVALLVLSVCAGACTRDSPDKGEAPQRPRNVVMVIVDTLRVDHMSAFGHGRATTPNLKTLAGDGVRFDRCIAQAPWTLPSTATTLTSLYPSTHTANLRNSRLPDRVLTLAEVLKAAGLQTQAYVSGGFVRARHGLAQGFDAYNEDFVYGRDRSSSVELTDAALKWLDTHADRPFFLLLHYYEPHYNYMYHREYPFGPERSGRVSSNTPIERLREIAHDLSPEEMATLVGYYDGEIRMVDEGLSRVMARLRKLGREGDTMLVFTADHGEEFMEHGHLGHRRSIYNELLRVPLVMTGPGIPAGVSIDHPVGTMDVAPTILEAMGLKVPKAFEGLSLLRLARGSSKGLPKLLLSENHKEVRQTSIQSKRWKLIKNGPGGGGLRSRPAFELYDLRSDPGEQVNLAATRHDVLGRLLDELVRHGQRSDGGQAQETWEIDARELELLRALGYADGLAPAPTLPQGDAKVRLKIDDARLGLAGFWEIEGSPGSHFAWSRGQSTFSVYGLVPLASYRIAVELFDAAGLQTLEMGADPAHLKPVPVAGKGGTGSVQLVSVAANDAGVVHVTLRSPTWRPSDRTAGSTDGRQLGVCARALSVERIAAVQHGAGDSPTRPEPRGHAKPD